MKLPRDSDSPAVTGHLRKIPRICVFPPKSHLLAGSKHLSLANCQFVTQPQAIQGYVTMEPCAISSFFSFIFCPAPGSWRQAFRDGGVSPRETATPNPQSFAAAVPQSADPGGDRDQNLPLSHPFVERLIGTIRR
jgi:hypothetical protein